VHLYGLLMLNWCDIGLFANHLAQIRCGVRHEAKWSCSTRSTRLRVVRHVQARLSGGWASSARASPSMLVVRCHAFTDAATDVSIDARA